MLPTVAPAESPHRAQAWRRTARHALLAMGVLAVGSAEAWTLDALLQLPLERLLTLRVAVPRTAPESAKPVSLSRTGVGIGRADVA